jgi:hypothetical protein
MRRLAAILMAGVLTGCACTQIGCVNRVEFDLAHDLAFGVKYDVEACIDGACTSGSITIHDDIGGAADGLWLYADHDMVVLDLEGDDYSGVHDLRVVVRDESEDVLTDHSGTYEFTKTEPNGGGFCGPTCWHAKIETPAVAAP